LLGWFHRVGASRQQVRLDIGAVANKRRVSASAQIRGRGRPFLPVDPATRRKSEVSILIVHLQAILAVNDEVLARARVTRFAGHEFDILGAIIARERVCPILQTGGDLSNFPPEPVTKRVAGTVDNIFRRLTANIYVSERARYSDLNSLGTRLEVRAAPLIQRPLHFGEAVGVYPLGYFRLIFAERKIGVVILLACSAVVLVAGEDILKVIVPFFRFLCASIDDLATDVCDVAEDVCHKAADSLLDGA
jgi:hypothetical protein